MENFEKVLKRELGTFEKHFEDFRKDITGFKLDMKKEIDDFKTDMKNEMDEFKTDMKNEMAEFKSDMKNEMAEFKSDIKNEMADFKTEVKDEIRERFFLFEQGYGKTIDAIYDITLQTKEIASRNSAEIAVQKLKTEDLQTKYLYHDDKIEKMEKKIDSKVMLKKVGNLNS